MDDLSAAAVVGDVGITVVSIKLDVGLFSIEFIRVNKFGKKSNAQ